MASVKGILFDLGDTLLDFGHVDTIDLFEQGAQLTYNYLKNLNLELPSFALYHHRQFRAIRWAYFLSYITRREFNSLDIIRRIIRSMGHDLPESQFEQLAWYWYEPLSKQATVEPTAVGMLRDFTAAGIKLGIVSNTFIPACVLDRHLDREEMLPYLPVRIYSCDTGYRKPDRRIFRLALRQIDVEPVHAMFVGDSPKADIFGAGRLGMATVLKDPPGTRKPYRKHPDHTIRSLAELPDIVDRYN